MTPTTLPANSDVFVFGPLCHPDLRIVVIGRDARATPARLIGFRSVIGQGGATAELQRDADHSVDGFLLAGLDETERRRVAYFAGRDFFAAGVILTEIGSAAEAGVAANVTPTPQGATFLFDDWTVRWAETVIAAANDIMRGFGLSSSCEAFRRFPQLMMRSGARVRSRAVVPTDLRRTASADDIGELSCRQPYADYFAVEEHDLRFRRFDGTMSDPVTRAVFISGDAAVVLPYDPLRDRVLLIEQWRAGPHARGDRQSWLLEAVAGRVDGGESPEDAAFREAREEADLTLSKLVPVANYYPSPAAKAEFLYTYIGIADLPDGPRRIGGLADEGEDIRAHVIGVDRLMTLVASGEINNGPLLLLACWLDQNRAGLRARHGSCSSGA